MAFVIGASMLCLSHLSRDLHADGIQHDWAPTTLYPAEPVSAGSCVNDTWNIYCIGGTRDERVLYASLSSAGIGLWRQTTPYGEGGANRFLSCALEIGNIYCVGGLNQHGYSNDVTSDVWFAPLVQNGVGTWQRTLDYGLSTPSSSAEKSTRVNIWRHSCVTRGGYIYCIGGLERTYHRASTGDGLEPVDTPTTKVFYAPLSLNGVGSWRTASRYGEPVSGQSCVATVGYIYCVGGSTSQHPGANTSDVWYARIQSDNELGAWTLTTSYGGGPVEGLSCMAVDPQIYCVGGSSNEVWSAPLSATGVGEWARHLDYPGASWKTSCVSASNALFCVGGSRGAERSGTTSAFYTASAVTGPADTCLEVGGRWDSTSDSCSVVDVWDSPVIDETLKRDEVTPLTEEHLPFLAFDSSNAVPTDAALGPVKPARPTSSRKPATFTGIDAVMVDLALRSARSNEDCARPPATRGAASTCHVTSTSVTLEPASTPYEKPVTVTATVTDMSDKPVRLTGTVSFDDEGAGGAFGATACQANGDALVCSSTYTAPNSGKQSTVLATYRDTTHQPGSSRAQLTLTGSAPTVTVTSSTSPSVIGQPVSFAATISPFDGGGGAMQFVIDGKPLIGPHPEVATDSVATSGSTSTLSVGLHRVSALFSGGVSLDDNVRLMSPSQGSTTQQVIGELKDQASCQVLGGSWASSGQTCIVSSLTVDPGNSFQIAEGVTLANTNGTIVVTEGGIISNRGAITNSGRRIDLEASTITIGPGGVIRNFGVVTNLADVIVEGGATLTNVGAITNECGATTTGAVSGADPVDACEAIRILVP